MRVIIVHGAYGSPNENWFPWLRNELTLQGYEVSVPTLPTPEGQSLTNWMLAFEEQVGQVDGDAVLIGHSAGATFILRLLEKLTTPVRAAVLVSGFVGDIGRPEFDEINATLTRGDLDWLHIRAMAHVWRIYTSDNDPYVPLAKPTFLSEKLNQPLTIVPGGRHLNASAGFTEFPQLRDEIVAIFGGSNT
ncbi:MAG TPA: alpha/beta fold hydrolase [Thermoanaerobaculia bacterium]|jgi:hypothetical protein